ncbi:Pam3-gp28 family putative phage holin [Falsiroseomonas tokyonensis]|uniref:Holin n=1 Tax=Falsiroseomonas tokyonensis TaxID=430521 RepID=A0ABV7C1J8_9PROT|nr:hypothetical protein [Falsiroseomonas tokyonensis]MBU8540795.1 hypothetical protein [Falsiroseomonas tokyonensis]
MSEKLAGQVRHLLTFAGGAIAGEPVLNGATADSLEQIVGGIVLTLAMQAWSWVAKQREARAGK